MKIGIFSDCHLGIRKFRKIYNYQNSYESLTNTVFNEALTIMKNKKVDNLIIAGDLFDNPNPSIKTIKEAYKLIPFSESLNNNNNNNSNDNNSVNGKVFLLGGNHDWSQNNEAIGCHAFDLFNDNNIISAFNEPRIITTYDNNTNSEVEITLLPYKSLTPENFQKIFKGKLDLKRKKDKEKGIGNKRYILAIHGMIDLNNEFANDKNNVFYIPKEVATNYDLVICGHVHIPSYIKTIGTSILTPGSLMPSNQAINTISDDKYGNNYSKPSVYIYDSITNNIETIQLTTSPEVINIITEDINNTLKAIADGKYNNNMYFIKYGKSSKDIDEAIYKLACQNVLNISIQTNEMSNFYNSEDFEESSYNNLIKDFWKFTEKEKPEYIDEFKNILKGD